MSESKEVIPDEAVEAAAAAYYGGDISEWDSATPEYREAELAAFRELLEAAAPYMRAAKAEAWDEGHAEGVDYADGMGRGSNPYEATK